LNNGRINPVIMKAKFSGKKLSCLLSAKDCDFNFDYPIDKNVKSIGDRIIGQERAVDSIKFGLRMNKPGYNIFVSGISGSGRTSTVQKYVDHLSSKATVPNDWCYVHNFSKPDEPLSLSLNPGRGKKFAEDLETLMNRLKDEIPNAFEGGEYKEELDKLRKKGSERKKGIIKEMEKITSSHNFLLKKTSMGIITIPIWEGEPIDERKFRALPENVKEEMQETQDKLQEELNEHLEKIQQIDDEIQKEVNDLDRRLILFSVGRHMRRLQDDYRDMKKVSKWLIDLQEDVLKNADSFRKKNEPPAGQMPVIPIAMPSGPDLRKYRVNLIVDMSTEKGSPVVLEKNATFANLIGKMERRVEMGMMTTDFTMIKSGALHRANGGYLVLEALDVLKHPVAWDGLKRALTDGKILIEDIADHAGYATTTTMKPVPIPMELKVVMIGSPWIYHLLSSNDEDFKELFKVRADFNNTYESTSDSFKDYCSFVEARINEEDLLDFDISAIQGLYKYGVRLAGDRKKVSTKFGVITDLMREASQFAVDKNSKTVKEVHIDGAVEARKRRNSLIPDHMQEMLERKHIIVETDGSEVGSINGLAVLTISDESFGKPSRITVNTFQGKGNVVNIERQADLSGNIHNKGVMILSGWLHEHFGKHNSLSVAASIAFEQSYGMVDGDSASSTELYAILSSISEIPINQGIAVTGSVNQKGEVQPIGGANEKVEGFYELCKARGFNGEQGVLIPHQNIENLTLSKEVVKSVEKGEFNIWAVKRIEEGIEILTGREAGSWSKSKKSWSEGSVFDEVEKKLQEYRESPRLELEAWNEKVEKKKKKKSPKKAKAKKTSNKKK